MHRDIKPENVLLCGDGFPKLADFGLSRRVNPGEWCNSNAGTPFYKAPEVMQHQASMYDFPADVFSAGNLLLDMLHPKVCMVGVFKYLSDKDKTRFRKNWSDESRPRFSEALQGIQKRMSDQLPGKRGSMYQTCQELLDLAQKDPMPHPFWSRQTRLPEGPHQQQNLSSEAAAEIAGRLGYALHCGVNVFVEGVWCPGYVKLISETICPGALTVCFKDPDGKDKESMICPWQFDKLLRPNPKALELFKPRLRLLKKKSECGIKEPTKARSSPMSARNKDEIGSTVRTRGLSASRNDGKHFGDLPKRREPLPVDVDKPCCSVM
jgi:serine/threonine protein kinase